MNRVLILAALLVGIQFVGTTVEAQESSLREPWLELKSIIPGLPNSDGHSRSDRSPEELARQKERAMQWMVVNDVKRFLRRQSPDSFFGSSDPYSFHNDQSSNQLMAQEFIAWLKSQLAELDQQFDLAREKGEDPGVDLRLQLTMYLVVLTQRQIVNVFGLTEPTTHPAEYYLGEETDSEPEIMTELRLRFDLNRASIQMSQPSNLRGSYHTELSAAPETIARIRKRIKTIINRRGSGPFDPELMNVQQELSALSSKLQRIQGNVPDPWNHW